MTHTFERGDVVAYKSYLAASLTHIVAYVYEAPRAVRRAALCRRIRGAYILGAGVVENRIGDKPDRDPTCNLCIKRWAEVDR